MYIIIIIVIIIIIIIVIIIIIILLLLLLLLSSSSLYYLWDTCKVAARWCSIRVAPVLSVFTKISMHVTNWL